MRMAMTYHSDGPLQRFLEKPRRTTYINWRAVNTMQNQPLDPNLVIKMNATVCQQAGHEYQNGTLTAGQHPAEVFILEIEKEFKFGKGKSIVAFADGGKNKVGHEVKYVKWYNLYGDDADSSKNKLNINEKTYTYGVDKAREFWNDKIKEGYNRVI
jgi:hypothetical protein